MDGVTDTLYFADMMKVGAVLKVACITTKKKPWTHGTGELNNGNFKTGTADRMGRL